MQAKANSSKHQHAAARSSTHQHAAARSTHGMNFDAKNQQPRPPYLEPFAPTGMSGSCTHSRDLFCDREREQGVVFTVGVSVIVGVGVGVCVSAHV